MKILFAVFEQDKIIRTGNKQEIREFLKSLGSKENIALAYKIIRGEREWEQSHWEFIDFQKFQGGINGTRAFCVG